MTRQQQRCLEFVRSYIAEHSISPTFREMADHLGTGPGNVTRFVRALEAQGRVRRSAGAHVRNLEVVDSPSPPPLDEMQEKRDRNTKILQLRALGESSGSIAAVLGVTRNTVCGVLHRANAERGPAATDKESVFHRVALPLGLWTCLGAYCRDRGESASDVLADAASSFLDDAETDPGCRAELTSTERERAL